MSMLPSTIILCNIAGSPEICNCIGIIYILCTFITWLQQDARSDWLFSGKYFLVITGHFAIAWSIHQDIRLSD